MLTSQKSKRPILVHMLIIALILFSQIFYFTVYAQEEAVTTSEQINIISDPALKLDLRKPTEQDFPSKEFEVTLLVDSLIDSNRVGVDWIYDKTLFTVEGGDSDVVTVVNGNQTTITKKFIPKPNPPVSIVNRKTNIGVRVNGFVAGENYISTAQIDMTLSPEMVILPVLENYQRADTLNTVKNITIIVLLVLAVVVGGFFGIRKFIKYLNTPDVT